MKTNEIARDFETLCSAVDTCVACPAMRHVHILGPASGPVPADVACVAEAPGRLGAAVTGTPLTRDAAGRRFEALLAVAGLDRSRLFVTNAALCLPLDRRGRNRRPTRAEVRACSAFLRAQLDLVRPRIVLALGATALEALALVEPHRLELSRDVGRPTPWRGGWLVPLYHPAARSALRRPYAAQEDDWRRVGRFVRRRLRRPDELASETVRSYDPSKHSFQLISGGARCG